MTKIQIPSWVKNEKPGDKVVCIDEVAAFDCRIKIGGVYTIESIPKNDLTDWDGQSYIFKCGVMITLTEALHDNGDSRVNAFFSMAFKPVEKTTRGDNMRLFNSILNGKKVEEPA